MKDIIVWSIVALIFAGGIVLGTHLLLSTQLILLVLLWVAVFVIEGADPTPVVIALLFTLGIIIGDISYYVQTHDVFLKHINWSNPFEATK